MAMLLCPVSSAQPCPSRNSGTLPQNMMILFYCVSIFYLHTIVHYGHHFPLLGYISFTLHWIIRILNFASYFPPQDYSRHKILKICFTFELLWSFRGRVSGVCHLYHHIVWKMEKQTDKQEPLCLHCLTKYRHINTLIFAPIHSGAKFSNLGYRHTLG